MNFREILLIMLVVLLFCLIVTRPNDKPAAKPQDVPPMDCINAVFDLEIGNLQCVEWRRRGWTP